MRIILYDQYDFITGQYILPVIRNTFRYFSKGKFANRTFMFFWLDRQRGCGSRSDNPALFLLNGLADGDVRNIFSLTKILEQHKMKIIPAIDGKEALEKMNTHPEVNIVLMDMMMPEMDGFESILKIRQIPAFKNIPIIAITAKAMAGDREKCIQAGASDYISKPVDMDQLISLLRIWLYEK